MTSPSRPDRTTQRETPLTQFQIRRNRVNEQAARIIQRRRLRQTEIQESTNSESNNSSQILEELDIQRSNNESLNEHTDLFIADLNRIRASLDNSMANAQLNNAIPNPVQTETIDSRDQCDTQLSALFQSVLTLREQLRALQTRTELSRPCCPSSTVATSTPQSKEDIETPIAR